MAGSARRSYDGFFSPQVFLNLLIDNAFLCIVAVGMTFVILSGGIDLSVGSVIALTTMVSAALVEKHGWNPVVVIPPCCVDRRHGCSAPCMGLLIQRFRLQPFIVTLAGMFLARGLCYLISIESASRSRNPLFVALRRRASRWAAAPSLSIGALIALVIVLLAHLDRALHALRPHRLRDRRQRAIRRADGPAGGLARWCGCTR